jgi:ribonuclease P protein component
MLKKSLRLRKKEDFDKVFRHSKPLFFNGIGCRYLANQSSLRLGFSLSKKHLPLASQRNRLRRVLAAAFSQLKNEWPKSVDIIFFTSSKPKTINTQESLTTVIYFLERIKENQKI